MNPDLLRLQPYPFERLSELFAGVALPEDLYPVSLSIGEPRHATPGFITEELITHLHGLSRYPTTRGQPQLRQAITSWLVKRFELPENTLDPEQQVLPVNGTREALFAFAQCVIDRIAEPVVLMPNPFYHEHHSGNRRQARHRRRTCRHLETLPAGVYLHTRQPDRSGHVHPGSPVPDQAF
jgi:N-succinyldiaminopimelate aminotransferase